MVLSLEGGLKCTSLPNVLNKHVKLFVFYEYLLKNLLNVNIDVLPENMLLFKC